jgi:hypothetical protein
MTRQTMQREEKRPQGKVGGGGVCYRNCGIGDHGAVVMILNSLSSQQKGLITKGNGNGTADNGKFW